jgi:hypothetical protein
MTPRPGPREEGAMADFNEAPARGFGANDVLVDQTMLCEASRLFGTNRAGPGYRNTQHVFGVGERRPSDTERLLHLSILLDALALHERLYVLRAELPEDWPTLSLRNTLFEMGVVAEFDPSPYAEAIGRDFRDFVAANESYSNVGSLDDLINFNRGARGEDDRSGPRVRRAIILNAVERFLAGRYGVGGDYSGLADDDGGDRVGYYLGRERGGSKELVQLSQAAEPDLASRPFYILGRDMVRHIEDVGSGYAHRAASYLRTFVYWGVSEHARVVFYPSCRRYPQIDVLTKHLRSSLAERVYGVVARAFGSTVEAVYEDEREVPLPLPPTLAVFLDMLRSKGNPGAAVEEFRALFAPVRRAFRELEDEFAAATSIAERRKIKQKIAAVTGSLKTHFEHANDTSLETVMGFAPEVLKPLSAPLDPGNYSRELLTKPVGWVRDWWRSRPFRHVFALRKRLESIVGYESLATQALGITLDQGEREYFLEDYRRYLALYNA